MGPILGHFSPLNLPPSRGPHCKKGLKRGSGFSPKIGGKKWLKRGKIGLKTAHLRSLPEVFNHFWGKIGYPEGPPEGAPGPSRDSLYIGDSTMYRPMGAYTPLYGLIPLRGPKYPPKRGIFLCHFVSFLGYFGVFWGKKGG